MICAPHQDTRLAHNEGGSGIFKSRVETNKKMTGDKSGFYLNEVTVSCTKLPIMDKVY